MRVKTKQIGGVLTLVYIYDTSPDIGFSFHTLAEVGEPWQAEAKAEAQRTANFWGKRIEHGVLLDESPWVADALVD